MTYGMSLNSWRLLKLKKRNCRRWQLKLLNLQGAIEDQDKSGFITLSVSWKDPDSCCSMGK